MATDPNKPIDSAEAAALFVASLSIQDLAEATANISEKSVPSLKLARRKAAKVIDRRIKADPDLLALAAVVVAGAQKLNDDKGGERRTMDQMDQDEAEERKLNGQLGEILKSLTGSPDIIVDPDEAFFKPDLVADDIHYEGVRKTFRDIREELLWILKKNKEVEKLLKTKKKLGSTATVGPRIVTPSVMSEVPVSAAPTIAADNLSPMAEEPRPLVAPQFVEVAVDNAETAKSVIPDKGKTPEMTKESKARLTRLAWVASALQTREGAIALGESWTLLNQDEARNEIMEIFRKQGALNRQSKVSDPEFFDQLFRIANGSHAPKEITEQISQISAVLNGIQSK